MNNVVAKEDIVHLYVDEQKTMKEVGKALGVSAGTIFNRMKEYGIRPRTQKEVFAALKAKGWRMPQSAIRSRLEKMEGHTVSESTRKKLSESKFKGGHRA